MDKTICTIDWMSYFYRAYYWLPELINNDFKQNINAVFWFTKMLLWITKMKPLSIVIAWEWGKLIKKQECKEYKSTRKKMDENFTWQMKQVKIITDILGINIEKQEGYEADDIIYTMTKVFPNYNHLIYSWDKDLKQLLSNNVKIFDLWKKKIYTQDDFIKEWWFEPNILLDYLILLWDSSDDIKGIKGWWDKTIKKLINQYWSIDNMYNFIKENPNHNDKYLNILNDNKNIIDKNKYLIWLMETNIEPINPYIHNIDNWKKVIEMYNFKSLLTQI